MNVFRIRYCVVGFIYVYVFGGYFSNDDIFLMFVEYYDYLLDFWVDIVFMNRRRFDVCVVSVQSKIFVIGGEDILELFIKLVFCEVYDFIINRWIIIVFILQLRLYVGVAVVKNKVFVFGGVDKNNIIFVDFIKNKYFVFNYRCFSM